MLVLYKDFEVIVLRGLKKSDNNLYLFIHALENAFIFFTYVVLSGFFSPKPQKYGVLVAGCIEIVCILLLLWSITKDEIFPINDILCVSVTGFVAGLILGILASIALFKNKGWDIEKPGINTKPTEQY